MLPTADEANILHELQQKSAIKQLQGKYNQIDLLPNVGALAWTSPKKERTASKPKFEILAGTYDDEPLYFTLTKTSKDEWKVKMWYDDGTESGVTIHKEDLPQDFEKMGLEPPFIYLEGEDSTFGERIKSFLLFLANFRFGNALVPFDPKDVSKVEGYIEETLGRARRFDKKRNSPMVPDTLLPAERRAILKTLTKPKWLTLKRNSESTAIHDFYVERREPTMLLHYSYLYALFTPAFDPRFNTAETYNPVQHGDWAKIILEKGHALFIHEYATYRNMETALAFFGMACKGEFDRLVIEKKKSVETRMPMPFAIFEIRDRANAAEVVMLNYDHDSQEVRAMTDLMDMIDDVNARARRKEAVLISTTTRLGRMLQEKNFKLAIPKYIAAILDKCTNETLIVAMEMIVSYLKQMGRFQAMKLTDSPVSPNQSPKYNSRLGLGASKETVNPFFIQEIGKILSQDEVLRRLPSPETLSRFQLTLADVQLMAQHYESSVHEQ